MDKFLIHGGAPLRGSVMISGAKNASLALMPATILADGPCKLDRTPQLRDVVTMTRLLETMGALIQHDGESMSIDASRLTHLEAPYELVKKMRASFYVLGPMLAKYGAAKVSYPGGCAWGPRPVNLHIEGLKKLGAEIDLDAGYVVAKAARLHGARIAFDVSSVGATGNVMMAAVLARGTTLIQNAAMEPEITHLADFLNRMGAKIGGIGTGTIEIEGVETLSSADDTNIPDRIEAGTFLTAAAMTRGSITIEGCAPRYIESVLTKLEDAGCEIERRESSVSLAIHERIAPVDVTTAIFPGFPTDMQAQWMALMATASGTSTVTDTIYFDRFNHVPELQRLGADITTKDNSAIIRGVDRLRGAKVMSTDLRASASLILAGLIAEGTTEVLRIYHLDRGYEAIERKLTALGAQIERQQSVEY